MIKAKFWVHSGGPLSRLELNCLILKTVPRLAQLDKRRSAERYMSRVQTPAGPTLGVLK